MSQYIYGAAVQGIQGFIFQTNELKDIIGASKLVDDVCTSLFYDELCKVKNQEPAKNKKEALHQDKNSIIAAAGNIKYVFSNPDECKKVVKQFPKIVTEFAPGITISQAVVEMKEGEDFADVIMLLEEKLRAQRNKPMRSATLGLMGIKNSRNTGLPLVEYDKKEKDYLDAGTKAKRENSDETRNELCIAAFGASVKDRNFPFDMSHLEGANKWIAVVHIDGNGLGQVVQKIGKDQDSFRKFSIRLDKATKEAAQESFSLLDMEYNLMDRPRIPFRPIVIAGDDFTFVCQGDLAMEYVEKFLEAFEKKSIEHLGTIIKSNKVFGNKDHLTACAGIAFIKSNYPFYYGYNLAEELCSAAKKVAKRDDMKDKGLPKSCLMFHKVQDSFVNDYSDITKRELTPTQGTSFKFGPYFRESTQGYWAIGDLMKQANDLSDEKNNAAKNVIRQWCNQLHDSSEYAKQQLDNSLRLMKGEQKKIVETICKEDHFRQEQIEGKTIKATPAYDILTLISIGHFIKKNQKK